jgi:uncharacterized membrane-anchored protein YhcB (DUF1043 family)
MGKRALCTGIIVGAVVGGLVSLTNKEARDYAKVKLSLMKAEGKYCLNNPSQAVRNLRQSFEQFNDNFSSGADSAVNALEQVENTLDKVVKPKGTKQQHLK